jgi:hypothetical protein
VNRLFFLIGMSGVTAALAGCTASQGGESSETTATTTEQPETTATSTEKSEGTTTESEPLQELPEAAALLDQHFDTLDDLTFVAHWRVGQSASGTDDAKVNERTIRSGDAGTLLIGDDVVSNLSYADDRKEKVWFTDHARISEITYSYNPYGVTPPYINRDLAAQIIEMGAFERVDVSGDDEPVYVFEAADVTDKTKAERDIDFRSFDVQVTVAEPGYIHSIDADITYLNDSEAEQTLTLTYEYDVSKVGEVTVTKPDFVDNAVRVEGHLTDDMSAIVLNHAGGPTVSAGTKIAVQDEKTICRNHPAFPTDFAPGDEAYVYWTSANKTVISTEKPSSVAREFVFPSHSYERSIYLSEEAGPGPERFEIEFSGREES